MYQTNIITSQIKDKSYLQRYYSLLLYVAKIKKYLKYINMNITTNVHVLICIYSMLQKCDIDPINMLLTGGLRHGERLRGLRQGERFRVSITRTIQV